MSRLAPKKTVKKTAPSDAAVHSVMAPVETLTPEPKRHELKCHPKHFQPAWVGDKTFEIRLNDRNFHERDEIVLREWEPGDTPIDVGEYTGREIEGVIEYLTDFRQRQDWVVFSYRVTTRTE